MHFSVPTLKTHPHILKSLDDIKMGITQQIVPTFYSYGEYCEDKNLSCLLFAIITSAFQPLSKLEKFGCVVKVFFGYYSAWLIWHLDWHRLDLYW